MCVIQQLFRGHGKLVRNYLNGEFGSLEELSPEIPSLLYAIDRYQFKDKHFQYLEEYDYLIANRYIQSNIGFQGAKFQDPRERAKFIRWMLHVESRNIQPDSVVFLDVNTDQSKKNLDNRNILEGKKNEKDIHEENIDYMKKVRDTYLEYGKKNNWTILNCMDTKKKEIKTIDEIHNMIKDCLFKKN